VARTLVVVNPRAGGGRAPGTAAAAAVADAARAAVDVVVPDGVVATRRAVQAAVDGGVERVVAIGGDGLVHHVVQEVAGTTTILGVVPVGTGNDWARGVGLEPVAGDATLGAAARRALADPVGVDALRTDAGWVASLATLGFSARVNARAEGLRRPRGSARYRAATLAELPRLSTVPLLLVVDGVEHELDATLVAFGTTACFGGAMAICPGADPTDGCSDVTVIGRCGRLDLLRTFPKVYRGAHLAHPAVSTCAGRELVLRSPLGDVPVWADGEPLGALPLQATTVAGALRVAGARPSRGGGPALRPPR
jgi:diacylglycerol kinase (ATP)